MCLCYYNPCPGCHKTCIIQVTIAKFSCCYSLKYNSVIHATKTWIRSPKISSGITHKIESISAYFDVNDLTLNLFIFTKFPKITRGGVFS